MEIAGSPKQGNPSGFGYIWDRISEDLGDIPAAKTYQVFITNFVLIGSRKKSVEELQQLLTNSRCTLPGVLEMSTLAIFTAIILGTHLYGNDPSTSSRCRENIGNSNLVVGSFGSEGLTDHDTSYNFDSYGGGSMGIIEGSSGSLASTLMTLAVPVAPRQ